MDNNNLNQEIITINNKIQRLQEVYIKVQKLIEQNKDNINQIQVLTKSVNSLESQIQNLQKQSQYLEMVTKFFQKLGKDDFEKIAAFAGNDDDWKEKINHLEDQIKKNISEIEAHKKFLIRNFKTKIDQIYEFFNQTHSWWEIDIDTPGREVEKLVREKLSDHLKYDLTDAISQKIIEFWCWQGEELYKTKRREKEEWRFFFRFIGRSDSWNDQISEEGPRKDTLIIKLENVFDKEERKIFFRAKDAISEYNKDLWNKNDIHNFPHYIKDLLDKSLPARSGFKTEIKKTRIFNAQAVFDVHLTVGKFSIIIRKKIKILNSL